MAPRRTGMSFRHVLAPMLTTVVIPLGVATAPSASALSCVGPERVLQGVATIYTGRIVDGGDHRITVEVEEIWRGSRIAHQQTLRLHDEMWWRGADRNGEIPDGYSSPETWLFAVPADGAVNACTAWPLTDEYVDEAAASYRPTDPQQPLATPGENEPRDAVRVEGDDEDGTPIVPLALGAAAGCLIVGGAVLVRRRRRR